MDTYILLDQTGPYHTAIRTDISSEFQALSKLSHNTCANFPQKLYLLKKSSDRRNFGEWTSQLLVHETHMYVFSETKHHN